MRILITGTVVFIIWCVVSAWIYNDHLLPVLNQPEPVPVVVDPGQAEADSLAKIKAMMPKDLLIYFEFDDARFKADPQTDQQIAEIKEWMEKYPGCVLLVRGHTDLVGASDFNDRLGLERAQAVTDYLVEKGLPGMRIATESDGENSPVADYLTAEGRAKNRRTEVKVKM